MGGFVGDLKLSPDAEPTEIALDEKAINIDGTIEWLFAAVDPTTNRLFHDHHFQMRTIERTLLFLRDLQDKYDLNAVTVSTSQPRFVETGHITEIVL